MGPQLYRIEHTRLVVKLGIVMLPGLIAKLVAAQDIKLNVTYSGERLRRWPFFV